MLGADNFVTASGITLSRKILGENSLRVTLFLKDIGLITLGSKNFGGDSEPFVWGKFKLQKHKRVRSYFVYDIEVFDDMLKLRQRKESLLAVIRWTKLLMKSLTPEQPDNALLANLYWSMKLLCVPYVPTEATDWRFIWQWIDSWGLAPDMLNLYADKRFNAEELSLLAQIIILNTRGVIDLFAKPINGNIRENIFKIASKIALTFLNEK